MKQMIVCKPCRKRWAEMIDKYKNEHIKIVDGEALADFLCDSCGTVTKIPKGSKCSAVSLWTDSMPIPYYPWEHDYIKEATDGD